MQTNGPARCLLRKIFGVLDCVEDFKDKMRHILTVCRRKYAFVHYFSTR